MRTDRIRTVKMAVVGRTKEGNVLPILVVVVRGDKRS